MMANERQRRLMQEALDDTLTQEALQDLYSRLDVDPAESAQFQRLRQVDRLMRTAPFERAPQTLALRIMAQLAQGLSQQQLTRSSGLALALGLILVTLTLLPLMAGIGWLLLNVLGSASALGTLIQQVAGLLGAVMNTLQAAVNGAQAVLDTYPELPAVIVTTIPIGLFWLLRIAVDTRQNRDQA
jgi:hypothetical protein